MEHIREEQLALYAGGDLSSQENNAVATHLRGCAECQQVLAEFQETRGFVVSALQNPEIGELAEVRRRLAAELSRHQSKERRWAWWMAGATAAALALLILPHRFEKQPVVTLRPEPVITASAVPEKIHSEPLGNVPHLHVAASRTVHARPRKAGIRTVALIAQADQEPVIKMTTADPNVVILWQTDKRTGQEQ